MSTLEQPKVQGLIEVTYSPERKSEMATVDEANCAILITLLKHDLEKNGVQDIKITVPKGKNRFADIIFEFKVPSEEHLLKLKNILALTAGSSVETISPFVVE